MKTLRIIAILALIAGIALAGLGGYFYFYNLDEQRAEQYSAEQQKLLAGAESAKGTARERELLKEYEETKGVTELAWQHARQTRQSAILAAGGGVVLILVSIGAFFIVRKRRAIQLRDEARI